MFFRKKIKPQIMITIPEPCSETWSEMRVADDCHRHCAACERTLTDFAQMNDDELLLFFRHAEGKICGRFRQDQLNRPLNPLPEKSSKANWWKAAALLPLTLFSKSSFGQQLSTDTTKKEQQGAVANISPNDSVQPPLVADRAHGSDTATTVKWNWNDIGDHPEYLVTGGVPCIITTSPLFTTGWTVTVDTTGSPPPKTKSEVGLKEAPPVPPRKKSNTPGSAQAAFRFQAIVPDSAKNK